ncbi:MAG: hypothetical protein U0838_09700 [Chloroflexota bacterium]
MYDATKPVSVAVSGAGDRVYVAQTSGDRLVAIFDASGKELGDLQPPSDNKPHTPAYVTVDPRDGDVYVTDRATGEIYVYSSNGSYLRQFEPKVEIPGWQPLSIALPPPATGGSRTCRTRSTASRCSPRTARWSRPSASRASSASRT